MRNQSDLMRRLFYPLITRPILPVQARQRDHCSTNLCPFEADPIDFLCSSTQQSPCSSALMRNHGGAVGIIGS